MATRNRPSWSIDDSIALYNLKGWGTPYVDVNSEGRLTVQPSGTGAPAIDLKDLIDEIVERGIDAPMLLRFPELLGHRVGELHGAFQQAMSEYGYRGAYRGVYPIKVNQKRSVVEHLVNVGRPFHFGLEAGSKPELLAVIALLDDPNALIVCNGYKDVEYVETALLASKLGRKIVLVVEKLSEVGLIAEVAERCGVRPSIGIRSRLTTRGAGRWEDSGGDRSKFGLSSRDLLDAMDQLRAADLLDCFELLHFHLGSQISSIRSVKNGVREAARTYASLVAMGAALGYLDVGGGLGVDYDGSNSDDASSINYTLQEYANDVVHGIQQVCDGEQIEHPTIVTESGRATVAHHAVLITEVLGVSEFDAGQIPQRPGESDLEAPLVDLFDAYETARDGNLLEALHDATASREDCRNLFNLGHLSLEHWGLAQEVFWALMVRLRDRVRTLDGPPEELARISHKPSATSPDLPALSALSAVSDPRRTDSTPSAPKATSALPTQAAAATRDEFGEKSELADIEAMLADIYFLNASVFQSIPDSWAIDQLFPIVPIDRLDEEPTRRAVLADITCDSDGKIDRFIGSQGTKQVIELHRVTDDRYFLATFLVGAYQEILGDLHNLFGDTYEVVVQTDKDAGYSIEEIDEGNTVTDVLRYVGYSRRDLVSRVRRSVESAMRAGAMSRQEGRQMVELFDAGMSGYTYLERG